jgi:hypothetical protein
MDEGSGTEIGDEDASKEEMMLSTTPHMMHLPSSYPALSTA